MTINQLVSDHSEILKRLLVNGSVQVFHDNTLASVVGIAANDEQIESIVLTNQQVLDYHDRQDFKAMGFEETLINFENQTIRIEPIRVPVDTREQPGVAIQGQTASQSGTTVQIGAGSLTVTDQAANTGLTGSTVSAEQAINSSAGSTYTIQPEQVAVPVASEAASSGGQPASVY